MNPKIEVAKRLTALARIDPQAIRELTDFRARCNSQLAAHPGVRAKPFNWEAVGGPPDPTDMGVRVIGLLDALIDGDGYLCALYDDSADPNDCTKWVLFGFGVEDGKGNTLYWEFIR